MNKKTSTAITTACVGMAVGTAAYMMAGNKGKSGKNRARQMKKNTGRALRQVSSFIDNVSYMMR